MLRTSLIHLSKAGWARRVVTGWPLAWRTASRFIAGETLSDAIRVVKDLNAKGINVTLDHLGEHTTDLEKAQQATADILEIFEAIDRENLSSGVSIKLTQIGLALSAELCAQHLEMILAQARERDVFVRIDMEDSPWVQQTLDLFHRVHGEQGSNNVGVVIQAYLCRSQADVQQCVAQAAPVRLCKGAYKEPADIAFPQKKAVDANFDRLTEMLVEGALAAGAPIVSENGRYPPLPAIATHDERRIRHTIEHVQKTGLPIQAVEFQMLLGIRRDLQEALIQEGYPVRVYVPYGVEWYPFFMRRLAERPANLLFFLSNLVRH